MKVIEGDLLELAEENKFDVIIHGCNCFNKMRSGIANQIRKKYPEAEETDSITKKGDINKLGKFSLIRTSDKGGKRVVINAYTQYKWWDKISTKPTLVDYDAVRMVFREVYNMYGGTCIKIGYPKIGAGLAGGDWDIISKIIDEELGDMDHTLVEYKK